MEQKRNISKAHKGVPQLNRRGKNCHSIKPTYTSERDLKADKADVKLLPPSFASSTSPKAVPKYTTYKFPTNYTTQGTCLILKDSDGVGFTYVTANKGVLSVSATPCQ